MKAIIYYCIEIFDYCDSIIIEAGSVEELREKCDSELEKRGATYCGSKILED